MSQITSSETSLHNTPTSSESAPELVSRIKDLPQAQNAITRKSVENTLLENQNIPIHIIIYNNDETCSDDEYHELYKKEARTIVEEHLRKQINSNDKVNQYLNDSISWDEPNRHLVKEKLSQEKEARLRKGPLMRNRRENRNTRKARIYRFTQHSYQRSRKATISKILDGTFSLDNESEITPRIENIEEMYVNRLEEGNQTYDSPLIHTRRKQSNLYGKIKEDEVVKCINEIKRDTASESDNRSFKELKQMNTGWLLRDWLWNDRGLAPGDKIRNMQVLSNTTPNQIDKMRRRCRQCHEELEDDQHILNKCKLNEGLMTMRHDHLVKKIGKALRRSNSNRKIWIELGWRNGREIVRPDLTMMDENQHCMVIEVTCPYEISNEYLHSSEKTKRGSSIKGWSNTSWTKLNARQGKYYQS